MSLAEAAVVAPRAPRMVFALDATASRQHAWDAARAVTDSLFTAVPGGIEIALAAHGGGQATRFGAFHRNVGPLRDEAASIVCRAGHTRMLDLVELSLKHTSVRAFVYIGDCFEEDPVRGLALADMMRLRGTKLIVLHDLSTASREDAIFFAAMAARTGGMVLPFDANSLEHLRDVLSALAAYVAGGRSLLQSRCLTSPASRLLLENLS
jgi:hypothetical protein